MKSEEGSYIYEIINAAGESVTSPYRSEKSLNASIKIAKKFDPLYHEKFKVRVLRVMPVGIEDIEAPRLCEDCNSPEHIEGSESCEVSYPKETN